MSSLPVAPYARLPFYFALVLLTGLAGFYPSYVSRLGETDLAHHLHGVTAFAWMVLLVTQATLIRLRQRPLHRRIGRLAFVLVPLFILAGLGMVWTMMHDASPFSRRFGPRLAVVDLGYLVGFASAFALAMKHRRDIHRHARYMAVTGLLILPPALTRLIAGLGLVHGFEAAFHAACFATEAVTVLLIALSARQRGAVRPFTLLLAVLVLTQAGFWAGVKLG